MNGTTTESYSNGLNGTEGTHGTFVLAPGAQRQQGEKLSGSAVAGPSDFSKMPPVGTSADKSTLKMDYGTDFPKLPDAPIGQAPPAVVWGRRPPVIQATEITENLTLTANERASRGLGKQFGNVSEEQQKCNQIATDTGTRIELGEAKDHSLTILITGKRPNVEEAQSRLIRELQTQSNTEVVIPKDYHGHIIGKEGSRLRQLEKDYLCRIYMPGRDEKSDIIRIVGPNEYIGDAARRIKDIGDEMAKQGTETLTIPHRFYPWIRGAFNQTLDQITNETQARINIPPNNSKNETIVITGEREGVERAASQIRAIYEAKKNVIKSVTCNVPVNQHRYIVGTRRSGIEEILRDTDVVVEVPPEDDESNTVTLYGVQSQLVEALALVYAKANSCISAEIKYPEWLRRYLIGPKGATLQSLVPKQDKLKLEFEEGGIIYLEGPTDVVKEANIALRKEIERLERELSSQTIQVDPALHRHIIGRNGALVNKLKNEHNVQITIPNNSKILNSSEISVEGKKEGVQMALSAIQEIVKRLENEKSRDIIIEQRFHGQIIGKSGENMQKWRQEFPSVSIGFPDATNKSDVVNLRGDKKEVDKLYTVMTKLVKELQESNYQENVSIYKEYYKHIIGKNGANINRIRDDTQTRIELPSQGDGRITVIGKQANVEKAIAQLNKIQNELASIVTTEVSIPNRIHNRLLSNGRRLIRDIEEEFGGVHILFSKEKGSDKVSIRGPKEDVGKAEKTLKQVAKHCEETTEEVSIATKPEYVKFLIGREGANVKKLWEKYPTVRIVFPKDTDAESNILLLGKKDEVEAVKKVYEKQISELKETVEISVNVEPKHHRHFISRSAEVLRDIQNQNGGCQISFPKQDSADSKVTIKGSKSCAESAKARIEEIVGDLEAQVTINVNIPEIHHRVLMKHLNDLRTQYNVRIKVPERGTTNEEGTEQYVDGIPPSDLIQITGRDTKCEQVKEALLALIPITKSVIVPFEYHRSLIGRSGETIRSLMTTYAVRIKVPSVEEKCEEILVSGTEENVELAINDIKERVAELERQAEDRKLRSFKVTIDVPIKYHQRLIGPGGARVRELSERHDVQVSIPRSNDKSSEARERPDVQTPPRSNDKPSETITITGYEANANACREEIEQTIKDLESMVTQQIKVDPRFHPRLIGVRGRNLRKLEEEYSVEIHMPPRKDSDIVTISGKNEDSVYYCAEYISSIEEDYINEMIDRGVFMSAREEAQQQEHKKEVAPQKVEITGAPWQLDNFEQFPSMGGGGASLPAQNNGASSATSSTTPAPAASGVWGNRRW